MPDKEIPCRIRLPVPAPSTLLIAFWNSDPAPPDERSMVWVTDTGPPWLTTELTAYWLTFGPEAFADIVAVITGNAVTPEQSRHNPKTRASTIFRFMRIHPADT